MADHRHTEGIRAASDQELVELHLQGDPDAFGVLFHRYYPMIRSLCLAVSGDADLAQEAAQVAFIQLSRADRMGQVNMVAPYLAKIARRWMYRELQQSHRRSMPMDPDSEWMASAVAEEQHPEERVLLAQEIRENLDSLPVQLRGVLMLSADGYTDREIAELLEISYDSVPTLRTHGRKRLIARRAAIREEERAAELANAAPGEWTQLPAEVATLPDRQRQVLERNLRGMKPTEIAADLGISPNAARVNLHHAKRRLAAMAHAA